MTVIDSSGGVDYLLGVDTADQVHELLIEEENQAFAAPEIFAVEIVSALRRMVRAGDTSVFRASAAVDDLASVRVDLFPMMSLRRRAWELRENVIVPDGMFVALAELLDEPLATKDRALAAAAAEHTKVKTILLGA